ncbi:hypothetical protein DFJ58DRAFT_871731 [Suillus subalutaceus]|uniref:uncharacterized protein n=1 Tax=Suillus subalutaceus TaxID=48586 RepID=UPI001B86BFD8|nr:uncharacterized protein DFJ58DRAFT_871731 [Suillus subalutaceus]KAG1861774.1 hypothetical protein DFJ58DRAFT_871731 [Suillus subalutaceus]
MEGCLMEDRGDYWGEEEMRLWGDYWAESEMEKTFLCPNCNVEFPSIDAVILHLNSQSTCWPHESCPQQFPIPPGLRAGYVFGVGKNLFDRLQEDEYDYRRKINTYYPFHDEGEWELGRFLVENLTQTQIDKFLKLKWFHTRPRPSFTSKDQLLDWVDALPSFVPWKVSNIEFTGYKTTYPVQLIWRDALEVIKQLFSDPVFANHITFQPHVVNTRGQREYGDYMSADMAWKIQDHLPVGTTQVPIILGSDKTPVTRITGGFEMHPLFITIGNLDSEVRSKATLRAWHCIAYMPIAKFCVHPDYQGILQARLWHKCVDLVCANLKITAEDGCFMPDPSRYICYVFTPLVAHVCDLPEATMIAVVDPWDLDKFQKAAKAAHLSGVHMPYWSNWMFACPSVFLTSEILHTCIKFFADHPLNWVKETVGKCELDARFMVQHKRVGTQHFTKGITHVNQMTGREHRDIQRTIVASIAGVAAPRFIRSIRALIEFIYLAQNPVHSPNSLHSMDAIIDAGARRGKKGVKEDFFIPKLELLQSFRGTVERLGTLMHISSERTNRRSTDFTEQCVRILNRQESMELFNLYTLSYSRGTSLVNAIHIEDEEHFPGFLRVLPDEAHSVHGPRPVWNHFPKGILSEDALTAIPFNFNTRFQCSNTLVIMPSRVVQAYPPSDAFPLGNCDTVLINVMGDDGQTIQFFHCVANPNDCPELAMWTVERTYMIDQHGERYRCGGVVSLTDVTHTVELIPEYGNKVDEKISSATSLESYDWFFLNSFTDKESYHTFSTEFT